jgi:hypothetical protein
MRFPLPREHDLANEDFARLDPMNVATSLEYRGSEVKMCDETSAQSMAGIVGCVTGEGIKTRRTA